jgi:hypothetical protein
MLLSEALVVARKRGRGVKRRHWSGRHLVIAWDDLWHRGKEWRDDGFEWREPLQWKPSLMELLVNDWVTCRP